MCSKYGVSGYPTLKIFRDGEDSGGYDGPRTAGMFSFLVSDALSSFCIRLLMSLFFITLTDGIVSHLKKQAGPASVELKSQAEFEKFIGDRDASVVGKCCLVYSNLILALIILYYF